MNFIKEKDNSPKKIIKQCKRASLLMTEYHERLSREGIAEVLIFCTCNVLSKERDLELIEDTLIALIQYISTDRQLNRNIDDIAAHIVMRSRDYPNLIYEILKSPATFDLKPIYCSFYRFPFTDVHFAIADPLFPQEFRASVLSVMRKLGYII